MKRKEILKLFKSLSKSNGFYGRLLEDLNNLDPKDFESVMKYLEKQKFQTPLDVVLFVEG